MSFAFHGGPARILLRLTATALLPALLGLLPVARNASAAESQTELIARHLVELATVNEELRTQADLNEDGVIDLEDLARTVADSSQTTPSIAVDVTPDRGQWLLHGPDAFEADGRVYSGDRHFRSAPEGRYTLVCSDSVAGYAPPASQTLMLDQGGAIAFQATWTADPSSRRSVRLPRGTSLELVRVPAGSFLMGRRDSEPESYPNEDPRHAVTIDYDFWVGDCEATKRQWEAVMETAPWSGEDCASTEPDSPAVYVSWKDAQSFLAALNEHMAATGQGPGLFRLPSESEWEHACRAGTENRFFWGDDTDYEEVQDYAWCTLNAWDVEERYAHIVARKKPNAFGLHDMSGNVWEWCHDWYHDTYEGAPADGRPREEPVGACRVVRGGSWLNRAALCRSAARLGHVPTTAWSVIGFRVVYVETP